VTTQSEEPAFPPELSKALRDYVPPERRPAVTQFLENCYRTFYGYSKDVNSMWWHEGSRRFGEDWLKVLFATLIDRMATTPLFDICDFRIATRPVEETTFSFRVPYEGGLAVRTKTFVVRMTTRRTRWWHPIEEGIAKHAYGLWPIFVDDLMEELTREVMSSLYQGCASRTGKNPPMDSLASAAEVLDAIESQSKDIEQKIGVPATHLIADPNAAAVLPFEPLPDYKPRPGIQFVGHLNGRKLYLDPAFIPDTVMLWHHTPDAGDAGMVMMLYTINFGAKFEFAAVRSSDYLASTDYARVVRLT
jgi:hypothetical protein